MGNGRRVRLWLAAVVFVHLAISIVHGSAHAAAQVPLSVAGTAFVLTAVLAGPLIGLALTGPVPVIGGAVVAATLAASLLFGLLNHFLVSGADHVAQVVPAWRMLFGWTAVLLALTEAAGSVLAIALIRNPR
jgi:hypothetical protein